MFKNTVITILFLTLFAQATPDTSLDRFFKSMDVEKTQDANIVAIVEQQSQQNPTIAEVKADYLKFMRETVGWKALEPEIRPIYKKAFTEAELNKLADFYETDLGKKTLKVLPELMAQGMALGQKKVQDRMPELKKIFEKTQKKGKK